MIRIGKYPKDMKVEEVKRYFDHANAEYPNASGVVDIYLGGDNDEFVDLRYIIVEKDGVPFQRIRRITGYLVGTLDRFNNAKRHEVEDRVKHSL